MPVISAVRGLRLEDPELEASLGLRGKFETWATYQNTLSQGQWGRWGVAQVVQHLPSKCKALDSITSTKKSPTLKKQSQS
jgi:hypothetical protein